MTEAMGGYFGVRAPQAIVGPQRIYSEWHEVQALAILNSDPQVRAAMAGNYRRFDTEAEAQEFADSEPIIYPQFLGKKWKNYARFVALLLAFLFFSFITNLMCDRGCGALERVLMYNNFCNACVDVQKILKDYILNLYSAAGWALVTALAGFMSYALQQL